MNATGQTGPVTVGQSRGPQIPDMTQMAISEEIASSREELGEAGTVMRMV